MEKLCHRDAKVFSERLRLAGPVGDAVGDGLGDLLDQDQAQLGRGERPHRHVA